MWLVVVTGDEGDGGGRKSLAQQFRSARQRQFAIVNILAGTQDVEERLDHGRFVARVGGSHENLRAQVRRLVAIGVE